MLLSVHISDGEYCILRQDAINFYAEPRPAPRSCQLEEGVRIPTINHL